MLKICNLVMKEETIRLKLNPVPFCLFIVVCSGTFYITKEDVIFLPLFPKVRLQACIVMQGFNSHTALLLTHQRMSEAGTLSIQGQSEDAVTISDQSPPSLYFPLVLTPLTLNQEHGSLVRDHIAQPHLWPSHVSRV